MSVHRDLNGRAETPQPWESSNPFPRNHPRTRVSKSHRLVHILPGLRCHQGQPLLAFLCYDHGPCRDKIPAGSLRYECHKRASTF